MSIRDIGALHRADEGLNHQIADTFATVSESDHAWTEKIWVSIARPTARSRSTSGSASTQPWDHRRLRRRLARARAVDGARQSGAAVGARGDRSGRSPTRSSNRSGPSASGSNRTTCSRSRSTWCSRGDPAVLREAQHGPQPRSEPDRRGRDPLPPGRLGDGHASPSTARRTTLGPKRGSASATTRGESARAWATTRRDLTPAPAAARRHAPTRRG